MVLKEKKKNKSIFMFSERHPTWQVHWIWICILRRVCTSLKPVLKRRKTNSCWTKNTQHITLLTIMGNWLHKTFSGLLSLDRDARILMLGLDAAGKTTVLYKLKLGETTITPPTIGFNVERVKFQNSRFLFHYR